MKGFLLSLSILAMVIGGLLLGFVDLLMPAFNPTALSIVLIFLGFAGLIGLFVNSVTM